MGKRRKRNALPEGEFTAQVTKFSHEGRGIAQIDGKTTFLFGALADETVKFRYTLKRSQFDEGQVTAVLDSHPNRVQPTCPHFGVCGGCSLQHMAHDYQVQFKQSVFFELLEHQSGSLPEQRLQPLVASPYGYRRKARISVKHVPKKEKVIIGFRERKGRLVADIDSCSVLDPRMGERINAWRDLIYQLDARDHIPQLEIALTDDTSAVILRHLIPLGERDVAALIAFCQTHQFQLYLQPKGLDSIKLVYPENASRTLTYRLEKYGLQLDFHPWQFIQVNSEINAQMLDQAINLLELKPEDTVLDLFCGIGNFTLPLAKHCANVVGVEGVEDAVMMAKHNADLNDINNVEFFCTDLFQETYNEAWAKRHFNKVLLDPPRAGAKEILPAIGKWQPERIVYVSCNPATLVRDIAQLKTYGYQLHSAGIMDMFPHTQHVEAMCLLIHSKA